LTLPTVTLQLVFLSATPTSAPATLSHVTQTPTQIFAPSLTPLATLTPTVCPPPPEWQRYVVGAFDTLALIAQRFNLTPDQLNQANCLSQSVVQTGQTIFVPPFRPTPTLSALCAPFVGWMTYIVPPGDTLSAIAARYGTSVYALMRANCLSSSAIYAGQRLLVPPVMPIITVMPTPIVPTVTPTSPIVSLTPSATSPADITPTPTLTTPEITVAPTETPIPIDTLSPTSTPTPEVTTAPPTEAPTEPPPTPTAPVPATVAPPLEPTATSQ
jgi:LysM repeat protein